MKTIQSWLKEQMELAEKATPGQCIDDDYICQACSAMVDVRGDLDAWMADAICDECLADFGRKVRTAHPTALKVIAKLIEQRDYWMNAHVDDLGRVIQELAPEADAELIAIIKGEG